MMPNQSNSIDFDPITQTITDILQIVGHTTEECKQVCSELQLYTLQLMFADLVTKAPKEIQDTLIAQSKKDPSQGKTIKLFQQNFRQEEILESYQAATYTIMSKYFEEVSPHLSDDQHRRISSIIQKQYSDLNRK